MTLKNKGIITVAAAVTPEMSAEYRKLAVKNIPAAGFNTQLKMDF
jgi:hypothetical protein